MYFDNVCDRLSGSSYGIKVLNSADNKTLSTPSNP